MTAKEFEVLLAARLDKTRSVLASKAGEYSSDQDRLHNFTLAARVAGTSPKKALWGMAMKHLVSVIDIVETSALTQKERADEKIGDLINYLILLEALLEDQRNGK